MKGIGINFKDGEFSFSPTIIEGSAAVTQNVVVVLSTTRGTDLVLARKGTDLPIQLIGKNYISPIKAQHLANFAALDALDFCKSFNNQDDFIINIEVDAASLFLDSPNMYVDVIISENKRAYRQ